MSAFVGDWQALWMLLIVGILPSASPIVHEQSRTARHIAASGNFGVPERDFAWKVFSRHDKVRSSPRTQALDPVQKLPSSQHRPPSRGFIRRNNMSIYIENGPSTTGNPSGKGRGNNPPAPKK